MQGTSVTGAMVFVAAGFLTGSELLDWLHLTVNDTNVSALAEATLVVVLFTDASRIDLHRCGATSRFLRVSLASGSR